MKKILPSNDNHPAFQKFLDDTDDTRTWNEFRDYDNSSAYKEVLGHLIERQHFLCAYCEIALIENDWQIEHVKPKGDPANGDANALDFSNFIACCKGGSNSLFKYPNALDTSRFLEPPKENVSCGQNKGESNLDEKFDPRALSDLPALLVVRIDGRVEPNSDYCAQHDLEEEDVTGVITLLGLNSPRLVSARANRWDNLHSVWGDEEDEEFVEAAKAELLPDSDGVIPNFFSTSRAYFQSVSDQVLKEPPQSWI